MTRPAGSTTTDRKLHTVTLDDNVLMQQLNETYEFDSIIYFSELLTPHAEDNGGLSRLRRLLQACRNSSAQMVYLSSPLCGSSAQTGKALLARTAEQLCLHYAELGQMYIKIIRTPYLYVRDVPEASTYLSSLFAQTYSGTLTFEETPEQNACFMCMEDLAILLTRVFDSWTQESEILSIPDVFHIRYSDLAQALTTVKEDLTVTYGQDDPYVLPEDDHILRTRYSWFPRYNLLDDLAGMYSDWERVQIKEKGALRRRWERLRRRSTYLVTLETLAAWAVAEMLVRMTNSQTQFSVVDFRLLFIVLIATLHGLNAGLFAALLASFSLAFAYYRQGMSFALLFYEPSNWLPFIAYFVAGAVCGYVQLRNEESVRFTREENQNIRERLSFVRQLYQDTLEDKRAFRRQILGRQDSFGKIYAVTQQLNTLLPQELFARTVQVMEDVLKNHSLMIYHGGEHSHYARLAAASPALGNKATRSLELARYAPVLETVNNGELWVNRNLLPDMPMYAAGVRKDNRLVVLIVLQDAEGEQLSLYFQNLFRILCGLVESSLLRAFEYETAARDAQYFPNSNVMRVEPFVARLRIASSMTDEKLASHLLLHVTNEFSSRDALFDAVENAIRESDMAGVCADGEVYLLMNQAGDNELPIIRLRLEKRGLHVTRVSADEEQQLLRAAPKTEAAS